MARRKKGSVKETDTVVITNVDLATADVTGVLPVANGGTGSGSYTDGQLLIGNTGSGNTLTKATLTAGSNITITNGAGSITIAASSSSNIAYSTKTDTASNLTTGEQETGLQVSITPSSASAKILVFGMASISGNGYGVLQLKDGSTYLTRGDTAGSRTRALTMINCAVGNTYTWPICFAGVYTPGVTTERTIKLIWHKLSGNDFYLNRTRADINDAAYPRTSSVIIAMEIS